MWDVKGNDLKMAEGDYGIKLPVVISGATLTSNDTVRLTIKTAKNGTELVVKELTPANNTVDVELTEAESWLLPVGDYVFNLDWYQSGSFMCNIIPLANFRVVDKA